MVADGRIGAAENLAQGTEQVGWRGLLGEHVQALPAMPNEDVVAQAADDGPIGGGGDVAAQRQANGVSFGDPGHGCATAAVLAEANAWTATDSSRS